MTKEQVSKMSTTELSNIVAEYKNKLCKMVVIGSKDLEYYAICEAELKMRKKNGDC